MPSDRQAGFWHEEMLNELQEKLPRRRGSLVLVKWTGGLFSYCAMFIDAIKASIGNTVAARGLAAIMAGTEVTVSMTTIFGGWETGLGDDPTCMDITHARTASRNRKKRNAYFIVIVFFISITSQRDLKHLYRDLGFKLVKRTGLPCGAEGMMVSAKELAIMGLCILIKVFWSCIRYLILVVCVKI
jgi:hypothetical protein